MAGSKNIFISHFNKDDAQVQQLKTRLNGSGCTVRNFSIDSSKHKDGRKPSDAVVQRLLDIRIKSCSTFICLLGPDTHSRPWVNYEIRKAYQEGKQVVGVYTHGNKDGVILPEPMRRYGTSTIGWNSLDKLSDIINGKLTVFENQAGKSASPAYSIERIKC